MSTGPNTDHLLKEMPLLKVVLDGHHKGSIEKWEDYGSVEKSFENTNIQERRVKFTRKLWSNNN